MKRLQELKKHRKELRAAGILTNNHNMARSNVPKAAALQPTAYSAYDVSSPAIIGAKTPTAKKPRQYASGVKAGRAKNTSIAQQMAITTPSTSAAMMTSTPHAGRPPKAAAAAAQMKPSAALSNAGGMPASIADVPKRHRSGSPSK